MGRRTKIALLCAFVSTIVPALSQTAQVKIGQLDLNIGGLSATVTPAQPVIPKNVSSGVQIVATLNGQTLTPSALAQYLGGPFQVQGEYSGPGLSQTVDVPQSTPATNSLVLSLPAVTEAGNYTLSNLRFTVNSKDVFDLSPSSVIVNVIDQVLVTSVQTQALTLDQIQNMGVVLDSNDYTGFQFTVGLQLSSQVVNISFPVVFDPQGVPVPQPLSPPATPTPPGVSVPVTVVPVLLQVGNPSGGGGGPPPTLPGGGPIRIPSVLVIPGNVGYLKQFFSAQLYVTNDTPAEADLVVNNISGTINLPPGPSGVVGGSDEPLGLPNLTSGPEAPTMPILLNGASTLSAGQTGQAQWTIVANSEGFYGVNFGINATLQGLPTGPVNLTGTASGGLLVRNPYFNMTFTVPGVVRSGELFNVYATVTNTSKALANNLTVALNAASLSGAALVSNPPAPIPTLNPGDSTTLTFQFKSLITGKVVADYLHFDTQDGTTGQLNFTLGVYGNGTPMSPDTIVLPSAVDNLPTDLVDAAMRVLGQAWSVANAPPGTLPAGVIPTTTNVVIQKALAFSEAGLRRNLGEPLPNAIRDLAPDFWGGSPVDPGFNQVLETTPAGQNFINVLGANLAQPMINVGSSSAYELQLTQIEASGPNFLAFSVGNGTSSAPVAVTLTDGAGNQLSTNLPGGSIPGGVLLTLGAPSNSPVLGLITAPTTPPYTLLLTPQGAGSADITIAIPRGDGTVVRGQIGVGVNANQPMRLVADFNNPSNLVLQVDTYGNGSFATTVPLSTQVISASGPNLTSAAVIGPDTVSQAGPFGMNMVLLFDRVVDATTSAQTTNYVIPNNSVSSASRQLSGRLVFGNLKQPEGPYVPTTVAVSGVEDQRGVVGLSSTVNLQSTLQDPGAVVSGRVLNADGSTSTSASVTYLNSAYDPTCSGTGGGLQGLAAAPVTGSGVYQFRYVRQDNCGGPFAMATTDSTNGSLRQISSYVRAPGQQIVLDLAMLGLGSVSGQVTDLFANPVPDAQVVAISGTDPQVGGQAYTDGNGNYTINGITVGPFTVKAGKGNSLGTNAGNIERAGTTSTVNVTLNGGSVNVSGVVTELVNGISSPVPGLAVVYYQPYGAGRIPMGYSLTASDGSYSIAGMPTGNYTIEATLGSGLTADDAGVASAGNNIVANLAINIPTTAVVEGVVTLPNGSPAAGVLVYQGQLGVATASDGTFALGGVPVRASQSQTIYARTVDGLRTGQTTVVVDSAAQPLTGASITLSGIGTAQFTVLDSNGNPVSGQQVKMADGGVGGCPDACGCNAQTTNASGIATFTGLGVGSVSASVQSSSGDFAKATANITQDGSTGYAVMQFHGSGTVTGSVVDPSNNAVLGATVRLSSNVFNPQSCSEQPAYSQSLQTDVTGKFQFNGVLVGPVGVTASQSFYPAQVGEQGTLSKNGATLNFPPLQMLNTISGVLSGTVYLPDGVTPAGAGVQVIANGQLPNVTVTTDSNGFYQFAKIFPQGMYSITAADPVSGGVTQLKVYLLANQNTTQNLRLLGTGTINVSVVDGAGVPVQTAYATLNENSYPNAAFNGSLNASNLGVISFPDVFEGNFSVSVVDPFGRAGRASGTLPQGVTSVNIQVPLTTTGTVQGHYYMPDGTTPIPNAIVNLVASGRTIGQATTLSTGDVGSFSFDYVPAGSVQLSALDPLSGRTGIAASSITTQGQVLILNVLAEGLDTVQGLVTSDGQPQPGASVSITSGTFQAMTSADSNGNYVMAGVPEGLVVATASLGNGFLTGTASLSISGDNNIFPLNVALRSSGSVTGQVVQADGVTAAAASVVTITVGGTGGGTLSTTTDSSGNFSFAVVPAGQATLSAQVLGSIDQGTGQVVVPAGSNIATKITLNGIGSLSGVAENSQGQPTAGTIALQGTGQFPYYLTVTAASNGTFSLPQVLAGPFTARLSANSSGFTLYGTASGTIQPNQNYHLTIQVQPSGTVTGVVLRPDGQTPAVGANVTIQIASGGNITLQAQNDGSFSATGVPLGSFNVEISDQASGGLAAILAQSLANNGDTDNLGAITLDGNALSVVSSNPTDGATGVGVTQPLTVTFSEALASTNGINVTNGTNNLYLNSSLSADGKTVTLTGTLPDGIPLVLNVTSQVTDVFGRQLLVPQTIHFTTVDLTPPYVTSILPINGAIQVPGNTTVVVNFNKALSASAPLTSVITLSSSAGTVAGTASLSAPNAITFTPSAPLVNNTRYNIIVNGAVSFGGNVQTSAFTSTFASPDTFPPVLQLNSPPSGGFVNTGHPTISIALSDPISGINVTTGSLVLDGQNVTPSVGSTFMSFTPTTVLADGAHNFTASVLNNAGIAGSLSSSFTVDTVPPSTATLSGITAGQIYKGQIPISALAADSLSGVGKINFLVDGALHATLTGPSFSAVFDTTTIADGSHTFTAQAVDNAGNIGPASAPIQAYISNIPLTISITSPVAGTHVGAQVTVKATTSKSVAQIVFVLGSQSFTVTSTPYQATFGLTNVPEGQQTITATATAVEGTVASTSVTVIVDHTPPAVNPVLIAANPPSNGVSVVRGLPGATEAGAQISIQNTTHPAAASAIAASDGSFSTSIPGAIGDVLSLIATDSAGNSSAAITFTIPQTAPLPQVSQVTPANASTAVFLNTHVVVRFTQPVAASSVVSGTLSLLQGSTSLAGTVTLSNDGLSLTFAPAQNLVATTQYTVSVTDVANGQTSPLFQSTFTTGTTTSSITPQVLQTNPQNGATAIPTNTPIMLQFNEAMDPATLTTQTFQVTDNTTGQVVPGMVQVDATGITASFVPQAPFSIDRSFSVRATSGMKDLSGNSLSGGITSFSFSTASAPDNQGPSLVGVSPANGLTGIPTNALVVLEFDKPLDVISASQGFQLLLNGTPLSGGLALSNGNKQVTFSPLGGLSANSTYTISVTSQITSTANIGLMNPESSTFATGGTSDTTHPSLATVSPLSGASGVPTNAVVELQFSKRIDPLTVSSATFYVYPSSTGIPVAGTISVSADGLTATFTPSAALAGSTVYNVTRTTGIADLEGQSLANPSTTSFTTGLGAATSGPTVVMVSPPNGTTGVAVNARVDVQLSAPVDAASVNSSAIQVSAGGTPVAGTVTVGSNQTTLTFTASSLLATSTNYTVTVSGFTDQAGNAVVPFTSGFTTGTSGTADTTRPSVSGVTPANGATGVSVNSSIVLTFTKTIDPTTVNNSSVPVSVSGFSGVLAGSYAVNGNVVTFTPLSALPGNATISVSVNLGVTDLEGNTAIGFGSSFTTATVTNTTAPQVLSVTPSSGVTNIGLNAVVTLTFSESLNPNTINGNTFGLLANGSKLGVSINHSADNSVVTLSAGSLPASSVITVVATSGVTDLSGNALSSYQSQFTTAAAFDTGHPSVVNQRPGNGATGVPLNASVLLYVNEAMNVGTIAGALHVSQNGMLVNGTVQSLDNGQTILFTPSSAWQPNALVQVFLDSTAVDTDGATLTSYQGSFTTAVDTTTVVPAVVSANPASYTSGVPTNVVMDVGFNEPLSAATVNSSTVSLTQSGVAVPATVSLLSSGTIVQIVPSAPLAANTYYYVNVTSGVLGTNGLAASSNSWWLQTGAGADTVVPTVVMVSPPNGLTNVSNNADVHVRFSKPINPLTVNGTTVGLSGGGATVPMTISFSNSNQDVMLVPYGPLPNATQMTLAIAGVTDVAGNAVVIQTTQFTTGTGPDTTIPTVINENPFSGATNVPLNTVVQLEVNKAVDAGTVASNTFLVQDNTTGQAVAGTYSVSADAQTITFLPSAPLAVSRQYGVYWAGRGMTDLAGNLLTSAGLSNYTFTTGTTTNTTTPQVTAVSPANGLTAVPLNAQVMVEFSEPVDSLTISQVTLSGGSGSVNVTARLTNGNQMLTLVPVVPLAGNTVYTVTVTGVQDLSGNAMSAPVVTTFTTSGAADITPPSLVAVSPLSGASGVPTNAVVELQFSKRIDPLTVSSATFYVYPSSTGIPVAGAISVSGDGLTATFTPSAALAGSTVYNVTRTTGITDLEGQSLANPSTTSFTTQ